MARFEFRHLRSTLTIILLSSILTACTSSANNRFFGKTVAPTDNVLRYISGSEPESLDPQVSSGQPEARIFMALYDGLVEYSPKDLQPIPAIAKSWEVSPNVDEFIFHLRDNAKFSDGTPITAKDFVWSWQRGFAPETLSRTASLGYFIKYSEAFNGEQVFVKRKGEFLLAKDLEEKPTEPKPVVPFGAETEFRKFIKSPDRVTLPGDAFARARAIEGNPKLKENFTFLPTEFKNAPALATKIKAGGDALTKYLSANLTADALACADANACTDAAKQALADGLNKTVDGELLTGKQFSAAENVQGLEKAIAAENKKRADANLKLDEEIAALTDEAKKAEKEKTRKKPIAKLAYANRFLLEQSFPDEIEPAALVPVKAEDIGVEAVDDYTLRVTLRQPAPFFLGLMAYQFFRVIPRHVVEKYDKNWSRAENVVSSGAFKVKYHYPYDELVVERNPHYWDAANVRLDGIKFYPVEELTTIVNLYKAGEVDAFLNHAIPSSWISEIRPFKDEYLDFPENSVSYYSMNVTKPPFDNQKVRHAFSLAIDRVALANFRKVYQPFYFQTPSGLYPDYDKAMEKVGEEARQAQKLSPEEWQKQLKQFDPERARKLLEESGFPVQKNGNTFSVPNFPTDKVSITYNTGESNKAVAEFIQAQWKQNLGITVPLKNMEFKTFLPFRNALQYEGMAQSLWSGDYMDPYTFLGLHYGAQNDGGSGFADPVYDKMLDDANAELDTQKRYEKLAQAEYYLMEKMPSIPLTIAATNWMKKPYIKGLYPNAGTLLPWKFVYIERDQNKWDKNVENILKENDPQVEAQLQALTATQTQR